jgi:hypothetical protein
LLKVLLSEDDGAAVHDTSVSTYLTRKSSQGIAFGLDLEAMHSLPDHREIESLV